MPRAVQPVFSIEVAPFVALSSLKERVPRHTPLFGAPTARLKKPTVKKGG
jgi:hypothetical protein